MDVEPSCMDVELRQAGLGFKGCLGQGEPLRPDQTRRKEGGGRGGSLV